MEFKQALKLGGVSFALGFGILYVQHQKQLSFNDGFDCGVKTAALIKFTETH